MTVYRYSMSAGPARWSSRCLDCDWHWPNRLTKPDAKQSDALQARGTARHHGANFGHRVEIMHVRCFLPAKATANAGISFRCHIAPHGRHTVTQRDGEPIFADASRLHGECRYCSWLVSRAHVRTARWFATIPLDVSSRRKEGAQ